MNKKRNTISTSLSKYLVISLFAIGMAGHLTGCAMGGSSDESTATNEETFAEESSGDFANGEEVAEGEASAEHTEGEVAESSGEAAPEDAVEGEMAKEDGAGKEGADDLALDDENKDKAKGDVAAADDELSLDDEEGLPTDIAANEPAPAEPAPIVDEPSAAPTDAPVFADAPTDTNDKAEAPMEAPADSMAAAPSEPAAWVPLKKMKTAAFSAGGANLNRVYVARPGETRAGIAQKIYGDKARSKDLLKWNGFLGRGVKTGDKIYYSSPTNPTDTNMMTYYEDVGIPAQNYVSRDGDNIREVSKTLLGNKESWKEVWATNMDVQSKGDIPAGLNIRYWPEGSAAAAPMLAQNPPAEMPPVDPMAGQQPPPMDPLAQNPPPAVNHADPLAPPPADPLAPNDPLAMQQPPQMPHDPVAVAPTSTPASVPPAVGSTNEVPPPAPPTEPPAAPAEPKTPKHHAAAEPGMHEGGTEEADNMMMMGLAGIVVLAAGAVFFLMRRSRSRKVDLTQTTQVG